MTGRQHAFCRYCKQSFLYGAKEEPEHCGSLECRARAEWTQEQWDGAARMASARLNLHLPLTPLDELALEKQSF